MEGQKYYSEHCLPPEPACQSRMRDWENSGELKGAQDERTLANRQQKPSSGSAGEKNRRKKIGKRASETCRPPPYTQWYVIEIGTFLERFWRTKLVGAGE
jgi:hypothetical protein